MLLPTVQPLHGLSTDLNEPFLFPELSSRSWDLLELIRQFFSVVHLRNTEESLFPGYLWKKSKERRFAGIWAEGKLGLHQDAP